MKERPIIYSTEMVKAILELRKRKTRRVIVFPKQWKNDSSMGWIKEIVPYGDNWEVWSFNKCIGEIKCPYGIPGDRLWVRETHAYPVTILGAPNYLRIADGEPVVFRTDSEKIPDGYTKWRPSIFMPRWASRITLEVKNVRVERVQDITEDDAMDEGVPQSKPNQLPGWVWEDYIYTHARPVFIKLWDSINGKRPKKNPGAYSWESNPWVWVVEFGVIKP